MALPPHGVAVQLASSASTGGPAGPGSAAGSAGGTDSVAGASVLPPLWLILGPPGAGKGTYAALLAERFGVVPLSTGELARQAAQDPRNAAFREQMDRGGLLPDHAVLALLRARLSELSSAGNCPPAVLLDGFPRTLRQAQMLTQVGPVSLALQITLCDRHIAAKLAGRYVCRDCGRGYNSVRVDDPVDDVCMPPVLPRSLSCGGVADRGTPSLHGVPCDCGGVLARRHDDSPDVVEQRLREHHSREASVLSFYRKQGVLVEHRVRRGVEDADELSARVVAAGAAGAAVACGQPGKGAPHSRL